MTIRTHFHLGMSLGAAHPDIYCILLHTEGLYNDMYGG